jgi:hypothetical protein
VGLPRIEKADGVVDGVNRTFRVPNPYVPGTLVAMINGRQLDPDLDNGWTETDPSTGEFEMKYAPLPPQGAAGDPGDLVSAYYENAEETAGGGSEGGVPGICCSEDVRPKICAVDDLVPGVVAEAEGEDVPGIGAEVVRPKICTVSDVRPRIDRVEEI